MQNVVGVVGIGLVSSVAMGQVVVVNTPYRLDYLTSEVGEQTFLDIDIDNDGVEDFTFTIQNSADDHFLGGLDFTRNNGFIGDFDAEDRFIFRTFAEGDAIGPDLEDNVGFETFAFAEYDLERGTSEQIMGGGLASTTAIIGFGFFGEGNGPMGPESGILYGWMRVTFGELVTDSEIAPSNSFIEISQIAYQQQLGANVFAGVIPAPGGLAVAGVVGIFAARRRRERRAVCCRG